MSLSWLVLMNANFLYGVWHDVGGIKEGIEKYGPQNRYKRGFESTSKTQREALFAQINDAVHNGGDGLAEITYDSPTSAGPQKLLRTPEVIHLQDVANLLDVLKPAVVVSFVVWGLTVLLIYFLNIAIPALVRQGAVLGGMVLVLFAMLLLLGPERVFNTLHIWIFPDDHQWFFYYQDSLMSTMMLAPRLFGWIAAALVMLGLGWYLVLNFGLMKLFKVLKN